jgi:hypothetical protein
MNKLNRAAITAIVTLLVTTNVAHAGSWICENGSLVREINVERQSNAPAPCSVDYNKDAEGQGSQILWTANNDGAYCDSKADGLAERLQGFGWTCAEF